MGNILVIGSSNTDLISKVERFPAAGETIQGKFFMQAMGGKGANQALAALRAGGNVRFATCVGDDRNGLGALQYYQNEGLDVSLARQIPDAPSGTAVILVNDAGENVIVINPGANAMFSPSMAAELEPAIAEAAVVMLQMEIPSETVDAICRTAFDRQTRVILNVAPARKISEDLIRRVHTIIVNETEIEAICGCRIADVGEVGIIGKLFEMGPHTAILTLGKAGSIVKTQGETIRMSAYAVETVDSTAAGDTFCGALAAQLANGNTIIDAIRFATAAAALSVTRMGAQPSIPLEKEIRGDRGVIPRNSPEKPGATNCFTGITLSALSCFH